MTSLGFPGGSVVKKLPANAGDAGSIPGSGRFPWKRKLQPNPVFIPGKSRGQRSLAGYSPWGRETHGVCVCVCVCVYPVLLKYN